jgi:hypothetical protein
MPCTITLSQDFLDNFQQSEATAMMNLAAMSIIEMKKLAPFAKPSQYPGGYPGTPGTLVKSLQRRGQGLNTRITSSVPYAIRRNFENDLNPQTKGYIERSVQNVVENKQSQWWQAQRNQGR